PRHPDGNWVQCRGQVPQIDEARGEVRREVREVGEVDRVPAPTGLLGHVPLGLDTADDDARGAHPAARARARRDPRIAAAPTHPGPGPGEYLPGQQPRSRTTPRRHTAVRRLLIALVLRD